MASTLTPDLCIIGAGSGGLAVAAGAVQMGAEVVLVEAGRMGGDCLNYGCVPSKSLIAAGQAAHVIRHAGRFGVDGHEPEVDFAGVHRHVHGVIAAIAPHDSEERFEGLGVRVIRAHGRFTGQTEVEAGGHTIRARRFVVATGSSPAVPPIPGLDGVPYLTNETVFDLTAAPEHLIVIGAGPIGAELAQAHRRLGSRVTALDMGPLLPADDREMTEIVRGRLIAEGVALHEHVRVQSVEPAGNGLAVLIEEGGETRRIEGSHLLLAAGRKVNVEGLGLEAAGVEHDRKGVKVDARLRSSNRRVFAIGDAAGGYQLTHVAGYHAGIVIRNALFRLPARADHGAVPRVTYTDPELAHVGLTEAKAKEAGHTVEILRTPFSQNDRAQAERETEGLVKAVIGRRGRVLGCSIVGPRAGELILPWVLALQRGLGVGALATVIAPYPTLSEITKRAAGGYYAPRLFSSRTRWLVRLLARLG
jgi:pyruvate/2-oxoglutarate dehydrogenase complex dihydrolipoamide dehydrogenase (E3) component